MESQTTPDSQITVLNTSIRGSGELVWNTSILYQQEFVWTTPITTQTTSSTTTSTQTTPSSTISVPRPSPDEIDYVIYHKNCDDGFGSAFAVWKYLTECTKTDINSVIFFGAAYSHAFPPSDLYNRNVLICDFSYKYPVTMAIMKQVKSLLIIDHHKTAQKELEKVPDTNKIFDMSHSGAALTWMYCFANTEIKVPLLIRYIEDWDIWKKELEHIDAFNSWFNTVPKEFEEYNKYLDGELLEQQIRHKGIYYDELNDYYIGNGCKYSAIKFCEINKKFYFVAYSNSSVLRSQIGNQIFREYRHADFSAIYSICDYDNTTSFSLRSENFRQDVTEIAKFFGGGGHRNSSACSLGSVTNHLGKDLGTDLYESLDSIKGSLIEDYMVVYINANSCKTKLGAYLLQERNGERIGITLLKGKFNIECSRTPKQPLSMAIVWNYNPVEDSTMFTVSFRSDLDLEDIINLRTILNLDSKNKKVCPGLVKQIVNLS